MLSERSFRKWFWTGTAFYVCVLGVWGAWVLPHLSRERVLGFDGAIRSGRFVFSRADSPEIQAGDELVAVEGDTRFGGILPPETRLSGLQPGESYSVRVRRGDRIFDVALTVRERRNYDWVPLEVLYFVLSVSLFALGTLAGWIRPHSETARWAWLAGIVGASSAVLGLPLLPFQSIPHELGWTDPWYSRILLIAPYLLPVAAYRFFEKFPSPLPESRRWRNVRWGLYSVVALHVAGRAPLIVISGLQGALRYAIGPALWADSLDKAASKFAMVLLNLALLAVLVRSWRARDAEERMQLAWPIGALALVRFVEPVCAALRWAGHLTVAQQLTFSAIPMLSVPPALFYGFQKHNLMGIQLVVRRTLQYLLARRSLNALLLMPVVVIAVRALLYPDAPVRDLARPAWAFGLLSSVALIGLACRQRMLDWLDRRFFREASDADRMLRQLLREAGRAQPFSELLGMVGAHLDRALHPEELHLLFRPRRGQPLAEDGVLAPDWAIVRQLRGGKMLEWPPHGGSALPPGEIRWLESCGAALLVPVIAEGPVLSGVIVLGERKSHLPYSEQDRHMLEALAAQLALAHQNDLLAAERTEAVTGERSRIARELHDTLAQGFAGINMHLECGKRLMETDIGQARLHVEQAGVLARDSLAEARRSVHDLRTTEIELVAMLHTLVAQFAGVFALEIDARMHGAVRMPPEVTQTLFRIAQECVTNSIKHSGASRADIRVELWPERVELEVRDEGRGFASSVDPPTGWGLAGMKERARHILADLDISSEPGKGTRIRVAVRLAPFVAAV